jgi:hypothetical protein
VPPTSVPPTPTVEPTPTPEPTVVDTTPVVIEGDGWLITEGEIAEMVSFVEETHQLSFTDDVAVAVNADIGSELYPGYVTFTEDDWYLLRALGLAESQVDRDAVNRARRDRIRGVCCQYNGVLEVAVEIQPSELLTAVIVVHELTHALHRQHPELFDDQLFETDETPAPFAAATEGVPQFVAFEWLALAPLQERNDVTPDLAIIRDDMVLLTGIGPARHVNFAYVTGPAFVDAVVQARGLEALSDLIRVPPSTTEQVLFPEKYLAGESAVPVARPDVTAAANVRATGSIGAAMLMFVLADANGDVVAQQMVEPWAGDRYVVYESNGQLCLAANIAMDDPTVHVEFADALLESLLPNFPTAEVAVTNEFVGLTTCNQAP